MLTRQIEVIGDLTENAARLATYTTSRKYGKEHTAFNIGRPQFNRELWQKGSSGMGNSEIRALWLFVNAGIQSADNTASKARRHLVRFGIAVAVKTAVFSGIAVPMVNRLLYSLFNDDDKDKDGMDKEICGTVHVQKKQLYEFLFSGRFFLVFRCRRNTACGSDWERICLWLQTDTLGT
jgi:hypothetical protein